MAGVAHGVLRASIMMVDPARQAASSSVNGSAGGQQAEMRQILEQPHAGRFAQAAHAARHGVERRAPGWWPGPRDCRAGKNICAAAPRNRRPPSSASRSRARKSVRCAGRIHAVPAGAQQAELPAGGVGHLHDQAAVGLQQGARGGQIGARIVEMLEHVEHGDAGAGRGGQRRLRQIAAEHRHAIGAPGHRGGFRR